MKKNSLATVLFAVILLVSSFQVFASKRGDAEAIVSKSVTVLNNFAKDPDMTWFRQNINRAKGVLIIPKIVRAGFIFGGSGGNGVLLRHNATYHLSATDALKQWSYPAFYSTGSISWGLQAGVDSSEVVMLIMTEKGMDSLLSTKIQLGADVSVAAGPVGAGAKVATADVLQFSRSKGIYGGLTLDGSVLEPRESWSSAYYGQAFSAMDILVKGLARNPQAYNLREKLMILSR